MAFKTDDALGKKLGLPKGLVTTLTENGKTLVSFTNGTPQEVVELRRKALAAGLDISARLNWLAKLYKDRKPAAGTKPAVLSAPRTKERRQRKPETARRPAHHN